MSIRGPAAYSRRQTSYNSSSTNGLGPRKLDSSSRTPSVESITKKTSRTQNGKTVLPSKQLGPKNSLTNSGANSAGKSGAHVSSGKADTKENRDGTAPVSSGTSDTSDNEKKKTSGTHVSSPRMSRKVPGGGGEEGQQQQRARTRQAGTFVSGSGKRSSVAAMISQFNTAEAQAPVSPTTKSVSPITKSPPVVRKDNKVPAKKPPPVTKTLVSSSLSKPDIKPRPVSPAAKESPPSIYATVNKKPPAQSSSSSVKKDETTTAKPTVNSTVAKPNPPLPPKPKSPPANSKPLPHPPPPAKPSSSATSKSSGISSTSTSSLSSASSSSISKASKSDDAKSNGKAAPTKQTVARKSSMVRASSNSSLTGTGKSSATKMAGSKPPVNHQRKPSPTQSTISSNKTNQSSPKSTIKNSKSSQVTAAGTKGKSISPPVTKEVLKSSENTTTEEESSPTPSAEESKATTTHNSSSDRDKSSPLPPVKGGQTKNSFKKSSKEKELINKSNSAKTNDDSKNTAESSSVTETTKFTLVVKNTSKSSSQKSSSEVSVVAKETSPVPPARSKKLKSKDESIDNSKSSSTPALKKPTIAVGNSNNSSKLNGNSTQQSTDSVDSGGSRTGKSPPPLPPGPGAIGKKIQDPLPPPSSPSPGPSNKPTIRPQKSSGPRRPPPEPPTSPPASVSPKKRFRSPPPPPPSPYSPKVNTASSKGNNDRGQSPQNYEEFVPAIMRSNSNLSCQAPPSPSPPVPHETRTKGEYSANTTTTSSYSARAYEDVELPMMPPPTSSLPSSSFLRTSSFTSIKSQGESAAGGEVYSECVPPPLPPRNYPVDDPVISLPSILDPVDENSIIPPKKLLSKKLSKEALSSGEDSETPPPLPSQPIPKRKSLIAMNSISPLLKRKEILPSSFSNPSPSPPPAHRRNTENVYEEIPEGILRRKPISVNPTSHYESADTYLAKPRNNYLRDSSSPSGSIDSMEGNRRFSASVCVSTTSGLSPVTLRRANSDKSKNPRIPIIMIPPESDNNKSSLQRTNSMDVLDDRMNQTVHNSVDDGEFSSEDEPDSGVLSPHQGLPQPPESLYDIAPPNKSSVSSPRANDYYDEEQEPLYQHINHLDFTSTPWMSRNKKIGRTGTSSSNSSSESDQEPEKKGNNQLEIARQLSVNHRKLWCEQPEVIKSGLLGTMNDQDKKLQEAMFEVITSEASYLRSLDVLIQHFMEDPGMNPNLPDGRRVITRRQYHVAFSNVKEIRQVSANFLHQLRERQKQSLVIDNICDIIQKFAESEFGCYVTYCTNQVYQMREMTQMLYSNTMFIEYVKRLESHKRCQNLSITSFLLLPMQRITRLPLLVLAILNRISSEHPHHSQIEETLRAVQKLVTACNDGARQMERTEELHQLHSQLNFGKLKPFPLVSISRRVERKGSLMMLEMEQRLFGKPRIRKVQVFVFALTDYVLITKRKKGPKGEITYKVIDYASKAFVEVEKLKISKNVNYPKHTFGEHETVSRATWIVSSANEPHSFLLILLDNASQKSEKYVLVCQNETECTRYMESISHPAKEKQKDDEKIYESWDCPQVQAVYDYAAQQHDELSLVRGDIVKVLRKMTDGWYEGEKLRDLQWGWFPSNFTVEIENSHTRARNLKERHRLLSTQLSPQQLSEQFSSETMRI